MPEIPSTWYVLLREQQKVSVKSMPVSSSSLKCLIKGNTPKTCVGQLQVVRGICEMLYEVFTAEDGGSGYIFLTLSVGTSSFKELH